MLSGDTPRELLVENKNAPNWQHVSIAKVKSFLSPSSLASTNPDKLATTPWSLITAKFS
jgi:hypothetical protein